MWWVYASKSPSDILFWCTGEMGILVAPLTAMNQFLGYAGNKVQSEKKLLRNVFKDGDVYFNTGDLLLRDHRGFLYFRDRIGDTFRYKVNHVCEPVSCTLPDRCHQVLFHCRDSPQTMCVLTAGTKFSAEVWVVPSKNYQLRRLYFLKCLEWLRGVVYLLNREWQDRLTRKFRYGSEFT